MSQTVPPPASEPRKAGRSQRPRSGAKPPPAPEADEPSPIEAFEEEGAGIAAKE